MILLIGHAYNLGKWYLQKGNGSKRRIVRISEIADQLERQVADGITKQEACEALMGLHALTGCDTVSAFSSKGKLRPMQMLVKNHIYVKTMKDIGKEWSVSDDGWNVSFSTLEFIWLGSKPAPEEVMELLSCTCKRRCTEDICFCLKAGLKCTKMCSLNCDNMPSEDDETVLGADSDDEDDE
jgi:hypothetical protein